MNSEAQNQTQHKDKILYMRVSKRGWAIVVMPDEIRADNFHGFPHIHFGNRGKHEKISVDDPDIVKKILVKHIEENKIIDKEKLKRELRI